ncbi:NADH dehydrogenase [ubiquinone] 1 alpha subcomplex subunit 2 [Ischnura elegans]|uniref:NADH dehydrogenase [ubiquinone] 1 alpha subcomplex subunit 2 n=1 Tax=Ischnura elegans TaxID=197161 RepID=UPI001ED86B1E|nr:NADH dehydrogenase [ubiquinone] 1 alpha subcomplex subunit 2 [Ischnura elegans]
MAAGRVVRFGPQIKEIRIHLCQQAESSKGVRDFIKTFYVPIKKANANFPILIRECSGVQPRMFARYAFGKESSVPLTNLKADEVFQKMESLSKGS